MKPSRLIYVLALLLAVVVSGCTMEQKLARSFVKMEKPHPFLVMKPPMVFKSNLKEFEIPGIDDLDEQARDSLLLANSMFLREISDSLLIDTFLSRFKNYLRELGLNVLSEDYLDSLLSGSVSASVINIAQFTLEEYVHPFSSEEVVYDEVIIIDGIDLNALNYNVWLELSRMNGEGGSKVLFASDYLLDQIDGTLKQNLVTGKYSFDFMIDTITVRQAYQFAGRFGEIAASLFYDYLMNRYIRELLPEDYPYEVQYYHYDLRRQLTYPIGPEERILEMEL